MPGAGRRARAGLRARRRLRPRRVRGHRGRRSPTRRSASRRCGSGSSRRSSRRSCSRRSGRAPRGASSSPASASTRRRRCGIGLVHEVADDLDAAVERVRRRDPEVRARRRRARRSGSRASTRPTARSSRESRPGCASGDEGQEGLRAFLEKRKPRWIRLRAAPLPRRRGRPRRHDVLRGADAAPAALRGRARAVEDRRRRPRGLVCVRRARRRHPGRDARDAARREADDAHRARRHDRDDGALRLRAQRVAAGHRALPPGRLELVLVDRRARVADRRRAGERAREADRQRDGRRDLRRDARAGDRRHRLGDEHRGDLRRRRVPRPRPRSLGGRDVVAARAERTAGLAPLRRADEARDARERLARRAAVDLVRRARRPRARSACTTSASAPSASARCGSLRSRSRRRPRRSSARSRTGAAGCGR